MVLRLVSSTLKQSSHAVWLLLSRTAGYGLSGLALSWWLLYWLWPTLSGRCVVEGPASGFFTAAWYYFSLPFRFVYACPIELIVCLVFFAVLPAAFLYCAYRHALRLTAYRILVQPNDATLRTVAQTLLRHACAGLDSTGVCPHRKASPTHIAVHGEFGTSGLSPKKWLSGSDLPFWIRWPVQFIVWQSSFLDGLTRRMKEKERRQEDFTAEDAANYIADYVRLEFRPRAWEVAVTAAIALVVFAAVRLFGPS